MTRRQQMCEALINSLIKSKKEDKNNVKKSELDVTLFFMIFTLIDFEDDNFKPFDKVKDKRGLLPSFTYIGKIFMDAGNHIPKKTVYLGIDFKDDNSFRLGMITEIEKA
jgi:hypothetical protein